MEDLLFIDNFDSFTYNIVHALSSQGISVKVCRNHTWFPFKDCHFLVVGPGPKSPKDAHLSQKYLKEHLGKIPILGICLGHQIINEFFGGKTIQAKKPMHGKRSQIFHDGKTLFRNIKQGFWVVRYHSLIVSPIHLPKDLEVSAWTKEGEIMA